jgi:maltose alpha-D-glucosyltransferase/alpha-amylase
MPLAIGFAMRDATRVNLPSDPLWFKDAVIYEVQLRAYADSDGDGVGDLRGLTAKLDYLQALGVTALWLLPICPSPRTDDGYDIADYTAIDPAVGTLEDFQSFVSEAHRRGLRVITELVLNHTSDQHPWFQRARRSPAGSPERDWYVWSDDDSRYSGVRIIFQDFEPSNWAWDDEAQAYFWHRFFRTQPDLNFDNPQVRQTMLGVVDFWFDLGVDGLRLDAVPYLFQREGTSCENLPETHAFLRELRAHVDARHQDKLLLAEANMWPEDSAAYMGQGDECHMNYHFPLMPRLFLALARGERAPIVEILARTPEIPAGCQWATFLRNHDELTLEMVTDEERQAMLAAYAQDPRAPINLGIRRRLAPLVDNDRRRIELLHALLFADLDLKDRDGVRTPMQWSAEANAGFSSAAAERLERPVIAAAPYDYASVNVAAQEADPSSLLAWFRQRLALRRQHPMFGRGRFEVLDLGDEAVYLTAAPRRVMVAVPGAQGQRLLDLETGASHGRVGDELELPAYGYLWTRLDAQPR